MTVATSRSTSQLASREVRRNIILLIRGRAKFFSLHADKHIANSRAA
jgi:hypothetical protein